MLKNILLFIKKLFRIVGIEIGFVKKKDSHSHFNTLEDANISWSDPIVLKRYLNENSFFYELLYQFTIKNIGDLNNKKVADIGCGVGLLFYFFQKHFPDAQYIGYEYSEAAIRNARKIVPNAQFIEHDIYNPISETFDIIYCTEVLEHLVNPDLALTSMYNSLDKGGKLIITVPDGRRDTFIGHINFWSPESWKVFIGSHFKENQYSTGYLNDKNLYAIIFKE
jgi:SAM-dependent methyltransferase